MGHKGGALTIDLNFPAAPFPPCLPGHSWAVPGPCPSLGGPAGLRGATFHPKSGCEGEVWEWPSQTPKGKPSR